MHWRKPTDTPRRCSVRAETTGQIAELKGETMRIDQMPKREYAWKTEAAAKAFAAEENREFFDDDVVYRARPTVGGWTVVVLDKETGEELGSI